MPGIQKPGDTGLFLGDHRTTAKNDWSNVQPGISRQFFPVFRK
ncbi:hypothetical protein TREPR_1156 [Treponema primitia ZAS-2]|uniref:Uncharacterized protein n=1 Tax=Treponema primitia (strain ATCC BAA-887 / DSM 12427 / ZAS-2) TaxID=545694 RepID=F5YGX1_TREPZ|nr:hypothetical protein TREPR_1156 [Treponema primitia ZAS-2]